MVAARGRALLLVGAIAIAASLAGPETARGCEQRRCGVDCGVFPARP